MGLQYNEDLNALVFDGIRLSNFNYLYLGFIFVMLEIKIHLEELIENFTKYY